MTQATWNNQLGHRSRKAWCLLITPDAFVHVFEGQSIPKVVAVVGTSFRKNGKWSYTEYRLALAEGVRMIAGHNGWETGRFVEGLRAAKRRDLDWKDCPIDRWQDLALALGVSLEEARRFLTAWRPLAAEDLDKVEKDLAELGSSG